MKGTLIQFRRGKKRIHERHYILDVGVDDKEKALKFVGKEVEWTSPAGKKIKGKIAAPHGNNGRVRAIFEIGLPGQAMTDEVDIK
jgi:large subunit ribosomal protein L35Ae